MAVKTKHLYKLLPDLPKVPEKYQTMDLESDRDNDILQIPHFDILNRSDNQIVSPEIKGYYAIRELEDWRDQNIGYIGRRLMVREVLTEDNSSFYVPHIDATRQFTVLYNLIDSGGTLCFWQEEDKDLFREHYNDGLCTNYGKLKLIDSVEIPPFTWYVINSQVFHSVENLTSKRKNIQFKALPTDDIVTQNLILI